MTERRDVCAAEGCNPPHRHPITGAPPDYHWKGRGVNEPRWRNPYRQAPDKKDWWYTTREIAVICRRSVDTIHRWVERGLAHGRAPGRRSHILIQLRAVEEFLRAQRRIAIPAPTRRRIP